MYKCESCSSISTVSTTQILRRVSSASRTCYLCRNKAVEKREQHKCFMRTEWSKVVNGENVKTKQRDKSVMDIYIESVGLFQQQATDFKEKFLKSHLSKDEFAALRESIVAFDNGNVVCCDNIAYLDVYKTSNQQVFTSCLYDEASKQLISTLQPTLKCQECGEHFVAKSIHKLKDRQRCLCRTCFLCNSVFKRRHTMNCINARITYQSKMELAFIKWCNANSIVVTNGPNLPYVHNDVQRVYMVDFHIPHINMLIEIKDKHVWHMKEVETGKWAAKCTAALRSVESGCYDDFHTIFTDNWDTCLDMIQTRYSLTTCESM